MFDFEAISSQIVHELTSLIDKDVIVTDKNGFIIAGTDSLRLNSFHEGAVISIKNQQEFHMTKEVCTKLRGVRPGIVMPIIVSGTPIGVLGITGNPSEVEKYAKLVRKVVELFITDSISREEKERGIREIEFFFFDLVTTDSSIEVIEDRARMINIDSSLYRRIVIIQTYQQFEIADVEDLLRIQKIHPELKIIRWGMEKLVLLMPEIKKEQMVEGLEDLSVKIQRKLRQKLPIGIGNFGDFSHLKQSFQQAETALAISERHGKIVFEEDLKLELLFHSIQEDVQNEFLRRTIEPLLKEEELMLSLEAWIQRKTSLQEIADKLHIHKNTLIYRLDKIQSILNVDLRDTNDLVIIYTALRLYRKQ